MTTRKTDEEIERERLEQQNREEQANEDEWNVYLASRVKANRWPPIGQKP